MSAASSIPHSEIEANGNPSAAPLAEITTRKSGGRTNGSDVIEPEQDRPSAIKVATDFQAFPDGTLVELICPQNSARSDLSFLIWNAETVAVADHFQHEGHFYTPPVLSEKFSQDLNLRLPSEVKACPSPKELFVETSDLIRSHVELPEASICLVAAFVLSTWFVDNLAVAPYLWICGPPESGKTTLLRLLHCLCRRAILIGGTVPSRLYSLQASLRPTLLLDELGFNGTQHSHVLESWLRTGNARGVPVTVGGQLVDSFGAKVLCSRQPASDTALSSRALHISMVPTRKNLRALDEETVERVANHFQPRLLMFRLGHYQEFRPDPVDLSPLSPRIADLARALVLPFRGVGEEIIAPVLDAIVEQVRQAVVERAQEPEALVITALFSYCHQPETSAVLVGQIASWVNTCRKRIGEEADLKPRAVGSILKSLGLTTDKLDSFGRGLRLTVTVKRRIHQLLQAYGLKTDPTGVAGCVLCEEMMRTDGADQRRVKSGQLQQQ